MIYRCRPTRTRHTTTTTFRERNGDISCRGAFIHMENAVRAYLPLVLVRKMKAYDGVVPAHSSGGTSHALPAAPRYRLVSYCLSLFTTPLLAPLPPSWIWHLH